MFKDNTLEFIEKFIFHVKAFWIIEDWALLETKQTKHETIIITVGDSDDENFYQTSSPRQPGWFKVEKNSRFKFNFRGFNF